MDKDTFDQLLDGIRKYGEEIRQASPSAATPHLVAKLHSDIAYAFMVAFAQLSSDITSVKTSTRELRDALTALKASADAASAASLAQTKSLTTATWVLAFATIGLVLATVVLVGVTVS